MSEHSGGNFDVGPQLDKLVKELPKVSLAAHGVRNSAHPLEHAYSQVVELRDAQQSRKDDYHQKNKHRWFAKRGITPITQDDHNHWMAADLVTGYCVQIRDAFLEWMPAGGMSEIDNSLAWARQAAGGTVNGVQRRQFDAEQSRRVLMDRFQRGFQPFANNIASAPDHLGEQFLGTQNQIAGRVNHQMNGDARVRAFLEAITNHTHTIVALAAALGHLRAAMDNVLQSLEATLTRRVRGTGLGNVGVRAGAMTEMLDAIGTELTQTRQDVSSAFSTTRRALGAMGG